LSKKLYCYWIIGIGTVGGIITSVLILMVWNRNESAIAPLEYFAKYPIEISIWLTNRLLGSDHTIVGVIVSDFIIIMAGFIQWALIGAIIGGIIAGLRKKKKEI
jgi:hypothetical protein